MNRIIPNALVLLVLTATTTLSLAEQAEADKTITASNSDYIYQYSIIDALLAGVYDGDLTIGQLKTRGDFGLGGFNRLDGELYMNEGVVYRIRHDGTVEEVEDAEYTSIAFVKNFAADTVFTIDGDGAGYDRLQENLRERLEKNGIYAIRISGEFNDMTTRAPAPAEKPYPPLVEHLQEHQSEFDLDAVTGTGVGFYMPPYAEGTNVPGFHFHFVSDDKMSGGHVTDFTFDTLTVEVDKAAGWIVEPVDSDAFRQADLAMDRAAQTHQVESGDVTR